MSIAQGSFFATSLSTASFLSKTIEEGSVGRGKNGEWIAFKQLINFCLFLFMAKSPRMPSLKFLGEALSRAEGNKLLDERARAGPEDQEAKQEAPSSCSLSHQRRSSLEILSVCSAGQIAHNKDSNRILPARPDLRSSWRTQALKSHLWLSAQVSRWGETLDFMPRSCEENDPQREKLKK